MGRRILLLFVLTCFPLSLMGNTCFPYSRNVKTNAYTCFPCPRTWIPGWWINIDYLIFWSKERFFPPLVATNDLLLANPVTLFGDEDLNDAPRSGGRVDFGIWLTRCLGFGIGYWGCATETIKYEASSDETGSPVLARPFFDVVAGIETQQLLSFPGVSTGSIQVISTDRYRGFDFYARWRYLASCQFRFDLLGGFIYSSITDELDVGVGTIGLEPGGQTRGITDHFKTENSYYAGLVGFMSEVCTQCWKISVTGKVGLGNMVQDAVVGGRTSVNTLGAPDIIFASGFLALPTNRGEYHDTRFEVFASIVGKVYLQLCKHLYLAAGYSLLYWPAVAFANDQIDLNINTSQLEGGTLVGPAAPLFEFQTTSFYVHGVSIGVYVFW